MPNTPDARGRILNSATKIFAEKSFAGARIDDIVKSANVPKSLIHYHFKNKDSILETLIQDFINELKKLLLETKTNDNKNKSTILHSWCKHFDLQEGHAQQLFANVYEKMHLAYQEKHL